MTHSKKSKNQDKRQADPSQVKYDESMPLHSNKPWHLYLIECLDGTYYAGITNDLAARFDAHKAGKGAKYTRSHPPVRIIGSAIFPDRSSASKAEYLLKQAPRTKKISTLQAFAFQS